jgi:hypothetical protein
MEPNNNTENYLDSTQQRTTAGGGSLHVNSSDGAKTGLNVYAFIPDQDSVVSVLTGLNAAGSAEDFKTTMGLTSKTLKQGSYFAVPVGAKITSITVTSGAIVAYKKTS